MRTPEDRERRMIDETSPRLWNRLADAMAWSPEDETPSWMSPEQRVIFWQQVAKANREAIADREMAHFRADLEVTFSRPFLWLGGALGRLLSKLRR